MSGTVASRNSTNSPKRWKYYASIASDTVLPWTARGIYVGTGGDLSVYQYGDSAVAEVFKNVPAGTTILCQTDKIAAATTATDLTVLE